MRQKQVQEYPQLAVSVALRNRDGQTFLLVKRGRAPSKGMWAFAGGRVEFGETMRDAAQRELYEETGLLADELTLCEQMEFIQTADTQEQPAHHYVLNVFTGIGFGTPKPADDADDAQWLSLDDMRGLPVTASTLNVCKKLSAQNPIKEM
ncbi:MAG: NUDIX domain-containing protein [Ahrensia sp.]|nr:NUDIX domain-containing protein [Ahrensia sp.]